MFHTMSIIRCYFLDTFYLRYQHFRYNAAHIQTRNTVERAFGVMKRRFPCVKYGLRIELSSAKFSMSIIGKNISRYIDIGIEKIL